MAAPLEQFFSRLRRIVAPTRVAGSPGTAVFGGYVVNNEKSSAVSSPSNRWKTYSELLANTSIVAAGTRYYLDLLAGAEWSVISADHPQGERFAEEFERMIMEDCATPWFRVVRRAAMSRFYGFSIQEWTARRIDDGLITLADIAPRPQNTIEQWDMDIEGNVLGAIQSNPQTNRNHYLPRGKLLYIVDDTLNDSPEGLGLFRHLVEPNHRLLRYLQLEGFGFETDLRGIPVGRGPFTELAEAQAAGRLTAEDRQKLELPLRNFMDNHLRAPNTGIILDSIPYESKDEAGRPSSVPQWDLDLLKGSANSFSENAAAIERINREMARILGVEQLMLGSDSAGSFAMSRDKTSSFFLMAEAGLREISSQVEDDILRPMAQLNGWPREAWPTLTTEAIKYTDVAEIAATLRDMASAGALLDERDPAVDEVRTLMGLSRRPPELISSGADAALLGNAIQQISQDNPDDLPDDPTQEDREDS